jgi:hypothetical protein
MFLQPDHEGCIRCIELHEPRCQFLVPQCNNLDKCRAHESSVAHWVRCEHGYRLYRDDDGLPTALHRRDMNLKSPTSYFLAPSCKFSASNRRSHLTYGGLKTWLGNKVTLSRCQPKIAGYEILVDSAINHFDEFDTDPMCRRFPLALHPCCPSLLAYTIAVLGHGKRGRPTESFDAMRMMR